MPLVTFKAVSPPATVGEWLIFFGNTTPWWRNIDEWTSSALEGVTIILTLSRKALFSYIRVLGMVSGTHELVYVYEITSPYSFVDGAAYTWNFATNSLMPIRYYDLTVSYAAV